MLQESPIASKNGLRAARAIVQTVSLGCKIPFHIFLTAMLGGCSLFTSLDGLSSGSAAAGDAATDAEATPTFDAATVTDAMPESGTDTGPITILQHHICPYQTVPDSFSCAFPVAHIAGNALLVHFYYNYGESLLVTSALTDDSSNAYTFLNIGDVNCPAGELPNQVCCTTTANNGTCQGWAIATGAKLTTPKPATVTFTISSSATLTDVMGAEVFEISGLADSALDKAAAMGMPIATSVTTPTVITSAPGELVIASIAFYTGGSTMTPPTGWLIDQDQGYFSAAVFRIGGAAGSTYGGAMGTITGMTKPGTSVILALKR
jgi:hypothetical protein